jgi:hypothetical protein
MVDEARRFLTPRFLTPRFTIRLGLKGESEKQNRTLQLLTDCPRFCEAEKISAERRNEWIGG